MVESVGLLANRHQDNILSDVGTAQAMFHGIKQERACRNHRPCLLCEEKVWNGRKVRNKVTFAM